AIRAIESVVFSDVVGARPQVASISVFDGVARQYEQIPLEGGSGSIIAGFTPAHDLAVKVGGARVCAVGRVFGATAVVGQGYIHLAAAWMHTDPLGTVHRSSPYRIPCQARIDKDGSLSGKTAVRTQGFVFALIKQNPLSRAHEVAASRVIFELGYI